MAEGALIDSLCLNSLSDKFLKMLSYEELKLKSISELIIPDHLQAIVHITSCLANNQCNDILISEIFELINHSANNFTSILYILNILSYIFPKNCSSYWKIYESIKSNYSCYDFNLGKLHFKEYDENFPAQSVEYFVACDNLEALINELDNESIDINQKIYEMTLIDIACKYGSEKCFSYLKLKGATISDTTFIYAVEGGHKNIIINLHLQNCFEITDEHLIASMKYHHNDIFDWLLETKGFIGELNTGECFFSGNIPGLLFLVENGFDLNNEYVIYILFIILMLNSSITFVYHYHSGLINYICL